MSDEFLPAGDLLEEYGFDVAADFLRTGIHVDDYTDECVARNRAEKFALELNEELTALRNAIDETRHRSDWRLSTLDRLEGLIAEWRERGERIEELESELRQARRDA